MNNTNWKIIILSFGVTFSLSSIIWNYYSNYTTWKYIGNRFPKTIKWEK